MNPEGSLILPVGERSELRSEYVPTPCVRGTRGSASVAISGNQLASPIVRHAVGDSSSDRGFNQGRARPRRRRVRGAGGHDEQVHSKALWPSKRTKHRRCGIVIAAVAMVVSGCGSPAVEEDATSGFGPLADLFGSAEDQLEQSAKVEDAIRSCMVRLGWEYTPVDQSRYLDSWDKDKQDKYIGEFGYGITTYIDQPQVAPVGPQIVDPNQKYVEKLSERERNAYYADLYGPPDQFSDGQWDPMTAKGCQNEAQRVGGGALWMNQKFQQDLSKAYSDIESDARMQAARDKWSTCMTRAGFEYESNEDIYTDLQKRLDELMGNSPGASLEGDGAVVFDTAPGGFDRSAPSYDKKALKKLQAEELAIARADQACLKKHIDKVREALEAEIVEQLSVDYPTIGGN
jgi:hypothetical protein